MKKMQLFYIFELNEPKKANVAAEEPKNLNVEWPPHFDFEALFRNAKRKERAPNAFILFRIKYLESLQQVGINYPMPIVSRMASAAWKRQPEYKKSKYESLSFAASLHWSKWNPKPNQRSVKKSGSQRRRADRDIYRTPAYVAILDTDNNQIFGEEFNPLH
ncbi:9957_t:CDS:1 [Ambispora gerdemannii]|uniref:9957_t:CDS:1 n=1 Tax=Ambispora gerdemannii TaxID=144530 RepID=A0A9N9HED7_9GLOM|nr:9957_t:CDS:1 [Ambispora gerdemannii]